MTYPTVPPRYIPCGGYKDLTIVDDDGKIKKVRYKAGSPSQQGTGGGDHEPPGTPAIPGKLPADSYGTASLLIAGMPADRNVVEAPLDADVVIVSNIGWRTGFRPNVPMWRVTVAADRLITANLPDELRETRGELIFVPDPGDR